jgi:hypothetical protein
MHTVSAGKQSFLGMYHPRKHEQQADSWTFDREFQEGQLVYGAVKNVDGVKLVIKPLC